MRAVSASSILARLAAPFVLGTALLGIAGCGGGGSPAGPGNASTAATGGKSVGVSLASMNHNFFIGMRQGVEEQLAADGIKGDVVVAEDNAAAQQQQVEQLISRGVGAIIMVPVDAVQAANAVRAANRAKIPVFCIDRRITDPEAKVASTIETDNVAMGEEAARYGLRLLCERYKLDSAKPEDVKRLKATVVHLWGLEAASSAQDRAKGFERVFNKELTPGVRIHKAVGDFNPRKSQEVLAPMLTADPSIEFVYCHNDDNAIGALNAVIDVKKGREPATNPKRVIIVGMDGNRAAIEAIRKGDIEATVSQEPIEMGKTTVQQVKRVLDGSQPEKPYIPVRHHLVTKKEADAMQGQLWADLLKGGVR